MTPLGRIVRRVLEGAAGSFWEGPELPARIPREILDFANANPRATRAEWRAFCGRVAETCWRAGYERGFEHAERDPDPEWRRRPPELEADRLDPEWRHPSRRVEPPEMLNPLDEVPREIEPEPVRPGRTELG